MAAKLIASVEVWDANRTARIAVPDVAPTTYDIFPYVTDLKIQEKMETGVGREASASTVQLAAWVYCPPFSRTPGRYPLM